MACNTETKTIGEREISVTQWPAEKALLMKLRLMKTIGPAAASFMSMSEGAEVEALTDAIEKLFETREPEAVMKLIKDSIEGVAIDSTRLTLTRFNEVFDADSLLDIYQIFFFVLKVNFGNLMKGQFAQKIQAMTEGKIS